MKRDPKVLSTKYSGSQVLSTKYLTQMQIQERALILAEGLTNDSWTGWYCKAFKALGESRYAAIATTARTGKNPKTLFGWLLKQEMGKN